MGDTGEEVHILLILRQGGGLPQEPSETQHAPRSLTCCLYGKKEEGSSPLQMGGFSESKGSASVCKIAKAF